MNYSLVKIALLLPVLSCFGCSNNETKNEKKTEIKSIKIKGSDTEFLMVQDLATAYMSEHPEIKIVVEGGGSNKGIEALLNNSIDICNSSREITELEIAAITSKNAKPVPIMFSVDALAIITNYKVGVDSLSTRQISSIFNGEINNWKELGGNDLPIKLFGRDKFSGTHDYFMEKFSPAGNKYSIKECASNNDILDSVTKTAGAIGYVGTGFLFDNKGKPNGKIWAMPVYIDNQPAFSPYQSSVVKKGDYVLTRPLYQYVNGKPNELIQDFILFELTKIGQDIIMKHGFYPINDYQKEINMLKGLVN